MFASSKHQQPDGRTFHMYYGCIRVPHAGRGRIKPLLELYNPKANYYHEMKNYYTYRECFKLNDEMNHV